MEAIVENPRLLRRIAAIEFVIFAGLLWLIGGQSVVLSESNRFAFDPSTVAAIQAMQPQRANYSGADYQLLWQKARLTNVNPADTNYDITGNQQIDEYIRAQGEARGYKRQVVATGGLVRSDGLPMQPRAARDWLRMKQAAAREGIGLSLSSAHRGHSSQAELFRFFLHQNVSQIPAADEFVSGSIDDELDTTLGRVAPTGYSKHHTGYTLDICDSTANACALRFAGTQAEQWLSRNNYANARTFGFIPSYPKDVENQGPNPEPWEFVWVGTDTIDISNYIELWANETN